jgi:hypothetical protein
VSNPFARPPLSVVQGGKQDDPPIPPPLLSKIRAWHSGKTFNDPTGTGAKISAPWVVLECIDVDQQYTFYQKTDVSPTSDDEDVALELWERCVLWVKGKNDGLTHNVMIRCQFAEPSGFTGEDFWTWPIALGTQSGAMTTFGGGGGLGAFGNPSASARGTPFFRREEDMILEFARLLMSQASNLQSNAAASLLQTNAMNQAELQRYRDRDAAMVAAQQEMIRDRRQFEINVFWTKIKVKAVEKVVERLGTAGPYMMVQIARWAKDRFAKKQSPKGSRAYKVFVGICEAFQARGAKTPEEFIAMVKAMGLPDDLLEDVVSLAQDAILDTEEQKQEDTLKQKVSEEIFSKKPKGPADENFGVPLPVDPFADLADDDDPLAAEK